MFDNIPNDFSVDVRTPDPVVVKVQPSKELLFVLAGVVLVAAAWVKRK
ncbi:hypothetical protein [Shewanella fidelis]|uniref:PEP-CTERM protein-sorting domain-containing protein n=1 Tax=Shewanella fidelis TaxID=173509 RepID=A0AAW8NMU3_9GAMM|nr:hypothetical protein [Shewanella fidelis]MDR8523836.1 hypothetical protein [Shewanella fidelis]MDW4810384.1 hypothetical protein [Shewanella fidelis]MDW4823728.1 hypothetical protein [Shewanella fidelis]